MTSETAGPEEVASTAQGMSTNEAVRIGEEEEEEGKAGEADEDEEEDEEGESDHGNKGANPEFGQKSKGAKKREWRDRRAEKKKKRKRRRIPKEIVPGNGATGVNGADNEQVGAEPPEQKSVKGEICPAPNATVAASPLNAEQKQKQRASRKAAELADFHARVRQGTTIVLDMEWEDQLTDKELKSLIQQVQYSYGANRSALRPVHLVFSGLSEDSRALQMLKKQAGFPHAWPGVTILETSYIDHYGGEDDRNKLTYLTADTDDVLEAFDPGRIYIVGGIVDHNRLKGCTRIKADEQQISTARLPLPEYIQMGSYSRVLTVNHIVDIVLSHQHTCNWRTTFQKCVPGRKLFIDEAPDVRRDSTEATASMCGSVTRSGTQSHADTSHVTGEGCGSEIDRTSTSPPQTSTQPAAVQESLVADQMATQAA